MIAFSTITANADMPVLFDDELLSEKEQQSRRVSRVKTLDGGCEIVDSGFSHSDRTMAISGNVSEEDALKLQALFRNEPIVIVAIRDGVFQAAIEKFVLGPPVKMSVFLKEKI